MRKSIKSICAIMLLMSLAVVFIPRKQPTVPVAVETVSSNTTTNLHFEGLSLKVSFK